MNILTTGVYQLRNLSNNKVYIGSTSTSFKDRRRRHIQELIRGVHKNEHLQHAWNKYGAHNFTFEILEECDIGICIQLEQFWIDAVGSCNRDKGYNIRVKADSNRGIKWTQEHKDKISRAQLGKQASEETKKRMSESQIERWNNEERRKEQSNKLTGKQKSDKHRVNISKARKGIPLSVKHRESLKKRFSTPQSKLAFREALQQSWNDPIKRAKRLDKLRKTRKCKGIIGA